MPIDPNPYARTFSSEPACRAVVAARLNAPGAEAPLLRRLRVRAMLGGLLDDPALLAAAAADVGLDPDELERWSRMPAVEDALRADIEAARSPTPAARRLDHKLGGPAHERRYTAPSYELASDGRTFSIPGYNPVEVYETALANFGLTRRADAGVGRAGARAGRASRWRRSRSSRSCRPTRPRPAPRWPAPRRRSRPAPTSTGPRA